MAAVAAVHQVPARRIAAPRHHRHRSHLPPRRLSRSMRMTFIRILPPLAKTIGPTLLALLRFRNAREYQARHKGHGTEHGHGGIDEQADAAASAHYDLLEG